MYEQSNSEDKSGKTNALDRKTISKYISYKWESEKNNESTLKKFETRRRLFGNNKDIIKEGSTDRISAIPYNDSKYNDKIKHDAYKDGFVNHGNQELLGKLAMLSEEELENIGYNDYLSGIVDFKQLPREVRNNQHYMTGHMMAAFTIKSGRSR